jgi:hypothetical protein
MVKGKIVGKEGGGHGLLRIWVVLYYGSFRSGSSHRIWQAGVGLRLHMNNDAYCVFMTLTMVTDDLGVLTFS